MSASGLPGRRVEAMRDGMTMMGFMRVALVSIGAPREARRARRRVDGRLTLAYGAGTLGRRWRACNVARLAPTF
jgi:hypothetical protein